MSASNSCYCIDRICFLNLFLHSDLNISFNEGLCASLHTHENASPCQLVTMAHKKLIYAAKHQNKFVKNNKYSIDSPSMKTCIGLSSL